MALSLGAVSAQGNDTSALDANAVEADDGLGVSNEDVLSDVEISPNLDEQMSDAGTVSGDVVVSAIHPWAPSDSVNGNKASLTYNVPKKATDIKFAYAYVNVYSGSAQPTYGSYANITIRTDNGNVSHNETLWINSGTTDGQIYTVNDHITKCYSDYMIFYDITNLAQGLNGSAITIDVHCVPMSGKSFDSRIKLVSLLLGYDDGDNDTISYWINAGQAWTDSQTSVTFDNVDLGMGDIDEITLKNIGLSSIDATYKLNDVYLTADEEMGDVYIDGEYYQYHEWDVTDLICDDENILEMIASKDGWGSFKEVISVLVVRPYSENEEQLNETTVSFNTEFSTGTEPTICIYAGTNNTVTATCKSSNTGEYVVEFLVDGVVVDRSDVILPKKNKPKKVVLTDPTVRSIDASTVAGADNNKVNYTVRILFEDKVVNSTSSLIPVVYNGYLGKDLSPDGSNYELAFEGRITGDIKIDIQDASTYLERKELSREDKWNVQYDNIVKAYVYVPYNYYIPNYSNRIPEDKDMFDVTFNGEKISAAGFYSDRSNLGSYAEYGYGLLVYDVTNYIKKGENTFVLNKKDEYPAVNPSALVYLYNKTNSAVVKDIYILNGADLLENSYNIAKRPVKSDSIINVKNNLVKDARLYVFATDAYRDKSNIIFNDMPTQKSVFKGEEETYKKETRYWESVNIKDYLQSENKISFVATGGNILALQQMIVVTKDLKTEVSSIDGEYPNTVFAGTNNEITINIDNTQRGKFTVNLKADGSPVNSAEIQLNANDCTLVLNDPTIREINEKTVMGTDNAKVKYTVEILKDGEKVTEKSFDFPILYNGYLGKDMAYPGNAYELFYSGTITGDVVIDSKDAYLEFTNLSRTDKWNVVLPSNSKLVKAYVYVPYYIFDPTFNIKEDENIFQTKFNGNAIKPVAVYRDQTNMGEYGVYGYGLAVYDVSALISQGTNSFYLNKVNGTSTVCPSTLIYLYDTVGGKIKHVYISNDADLLGTTAFNTTGKTIRSDSTINVNVDDVAGAKLYVFAIDAQKGDSNIIFNDKTYKDVWDGDMNSVEMYSLDITDAIKKTNLISMVGTGDSILSLQRIIVVTGNEIGKVSTKIAASGVTTQYNGGKYLTVTLKDNQGNPIKGAKVSVNINGAKTLTTNANGQVKLSTNGLAPKTYTAKITFAGDANYAKSSATAKVVVKKATPKLTAAKKTFKKSVKTKKYVVNLKTNLKKPIKKVYVTLKVNKKTYKVKTNSKGQAIFKITNLKKKGTFTAVVKYAGSKYYSAKTVKPKIVVK